MSDRDLQDYLFYDLDYDPWQMRNLVSIIADGFQARE